MFVYLAHSGAEVQFPTVVAVKVTTESVTLLDARNEVVAVFPVGVVLMHSEVPVQNALDGATKP